MAHKPIRTTLAGALLAGVLVAPVFVAPASAQSPGQSKPVAQFGDWSVYVGTSGAKVCYAISQPKSRAPAGLKRDPAYFFVSTRPGDSVKNEISITTGFPMKDGTDAVLTIGSDTFQLYTKSEGAWVRNVQEENRIVDAMRKGKNLTLVGTSGRGNKTTDTYSLSGIAQALDRVAQECR